MLRSVFLYNLLVLTSRYAELPLAVTYKDFACFFSLQVTAITAFVVARSDTFKRSARIKYNPMLIRQHLLSIVS